MGSSHIYIEKSTISYILNDTTSQCKVIFIAKYQVPQNYKLVIIGSHQGLGDWKVEAGLEMKECAEGWRAEMELKHKTLEYQYALVNPQGYAKLELHKSLLEFPRLSPFRITQDQQRSTFVKDYTHAFVEVIVQKQVPEWLSLYLVGNIKELGMGNILDGVRLRREGNQWVGQFNIKSQNILDQKKIEYQYIISDTQNLLDSVSVKESGDKHLIRFDESEFKFIDQELEEYQKGEKTASYINYLKPKYDFLIAYRDNQQKHNQQQ